MMCSALWTTNLASYLLSEYCLECRCTAWLLVVSKVFRYQPRRLDQSYNGPTNEKKYAKIFDYEDLKDK